VSLILEFLARWNCEWILRAAVLCIDLPKTAEFQLPPGAFAFDWNILGYAIGLVKTRKAQLAIARGAYRSAILVSFCTVSRR